MITAWIETRQDDGSRCGPASSKQFDSMEDLHAWSANQCGHPYLHVAIIRIYEDDKLIRSEGAIKLATIISKLDRWIPEQPWDGDYEYNGVSEAIIKWEATKMQMLPEEIELAHRIRI